MKRVPRALSQPPLRAHAPRRRLYASRASQQPAAHVPSQRIECALARGVQAFPGRPVAPPRLAQLRGHGLAGSVQALERLVMDERAFPCEPGLAAIARTGGIRAQAIKPAD